MLPTIGVVITLASLVIALPTTDIRLHISSVPPPRPADGEICWLKCFPEEPQCPPEFVSSHAILSLHQNTKLTHDYSTASHTSGEIRHVPLLTMLIC